MKTKEEIMEIVSHFKQVDGDAITVDERSIVQAYNDNKDEQTLAIKILSVFGAVISSLAYVAFLYSLGILESGITSSILGLLCVLGAIFINRSTKKFSFDTINLTLYGLGILQIGLGLSHLEKDVSLLCSIYIVIALVTLVLTQRYMLSFIAVLLLGGSILALLVNEDLHIVIPYYLSVIAMLLTYQSLHEAKIIRANKAFLELYRPIRTALLFLTIGILLFISRQFLDTNLPYMWLLSVVSVGLICCVIYTLFTRFQIKDVRTQIGIYLFTVLLLIPTILSPALATSLLIVLLSFKVNHKTGLVVGIVSFIYFIGLFYYDLNYTLLQKSILLFTTGLLFGIVYFFTFKKIKSR